MELALDDDPKQPGGNFYVEMFQSLFSWNLLLMIWRYKQRRCYYEVSILVFVELALDDDPKQPGGNFYVEMFQSLFSWNLLLMTRPC